MDDPLHGLAALGQSIWLDYVRRGLLTSGELARLTREQAVTGVTSNPSIFEKAIDGSTDYDEAIAAAAPGASALQVYDGLTVADIGAAADVLRPIYDGSEGRDGFVSIEVAPGLAHDTEGSLREARRLWGALQRPNIMIKIPATPEGYPAIRRLIAEGVNVNITLMFSLGHYEAVAEAYLAGLEERAAAGRPVDRLASVASFFVSRVDTKVDPLLASAGRSDLCGRVAVANAQCCYARFRELFGGPRFAALAARGAHVQRPLWASTSTKNHAYSDVLYVEELAGADTVNTMPPQTLQAYRDHGRPAARVGADPAAAAAVLAALPALGIDLDQVAAELQQEGVAAFADAFGKAVASIERKRSALSAQPASEPSLGAAAPAFAAARRRLAEQRLVRRLFDRDPTAWKQEPAHQAIIRNALGWLDMPEKMAARAPELAAFAREVAGDGMTDAVLVGMGGSSLAPDVMARMLGTQPGGLRLHVLDTSAPDDILALRERLDLDHTLVIVSSKSGGTTEAVSLFRYFWRESGGAGRRFVAITDPGTWLAEQAQQLGFRRLFLNPADIGGRYSALSYFGLVPAALLGTDVAALLDRAQTMRHACEPAAGPDGNPAADLGAAMAGLAGGGRDKVSFVGAADLQPLGDWLEQLLAESTGKEGRGLIPVAGEALGPPEVYGEDRFFVHFYREQVDPRVEALARAGQPVWPLRIGSLGAAFLQWEVATALAGALLGIDAFDQPNVQESKDNTVAMLRQGGLPDLPDLGVQGAAGFLGGVRPGDYVAIMAYLPRRPAVARAVERVRLAVRDRLRVATTVGFGPRFLHSTGQLHKGGPDTCVALQLTCRPARDADIPEAPYSFGTLWAAQAAGDLQALLRHGRRAGRVDLGAEPEAALERLADRLEADLAPRRS